MGACTLVLSMCEFFLGEFRLQVSSRRKEQKKIHAHSRVGRKCMLTFAHKHSIGLLLSGVMRFNQNSRRKHKICYCPKIFPYLLVSTLVKDNISYYQSLKIVNNIFTFYTSCLSFPLKYFTYLFFSEYYLFP